MIREFDAGWVVPPSDDEAWKSALTEAASPDALRTKQLGAIRLSGERFAPEAALRSAAASLMSS